MTPGSASGRRSSTSPTRMMSSVRQLEIAVDDVVAVAVGGNVRYQGKGARHGIVVRAGEALCGRTGLHIFVGSDWDPAVVDNACLRCVAVLGLSPREVPPG